MTKTKPKDIEDSGRKNPDVKVYTDGKEWAKAFKEHNDKVSPPVEKYKGNVIHQATQFKFEVDGSVYYVVCPPGKIGNNKFTVYSEERGKILSYSLRGNHVNKTMAELVLRLALVNLNSLNHDKN